MNESAARFYLDQVSGRSRLESIKDLTAPAQPDVVPDLRVQAVHDSPLTRTRTVKFQQTRSSIPVFGSQVVVELDATRKLVAVDAELADLKKVSQSPSSAPVRRWARSRSLQA